MAATEPQAPSCPEEGPHHRLIALLVGRSVGDIGDVAQTLWDSLSRQLVALIGQEGFHALYDRSLHLASARFAWLAPADAPTAAQPRLEALACALRARAADEARKATIELLWTFTGLLSSLIGDNLTTNILRTAWGSAFDQAVQDIGPWAKK
jgi:hypothetical protein